MTTLSPELPVGAVLGADRERHVLPGVDRLQRDVEGELATRACSADGHPVGVPAVVAGLVAQPPEYIEFLLF
jgi:hypothetical protein